MFSIFILQKQLLKMKYFSQLLLTGGICIVQVANENTLDNSNSKSAEVMNQMIDLIAILSTCMTSSFASIYFEKILKKGQTISLFV